MVNREIITKSARDRVTSPLVGGEGIAKNESLVLVLRHK